MTPEEVIREFELCREMILLNPSTGATYTLEQIKSWNDDNYRLYVACGIAIEAMKKQIPRVPKDSLKIKPVIDKNGAYVDADITVYFFCPNCGEMVGINENVDKFCRECGQAIDTVNLEEKE